MIGKLKRALRAAIESQGYHVRPTNQFGLSFGEDLRRLLRGRTQPQIIDVGANAGQWLRSIKGTFPGARVLSYEPDARASPLCRKPREDLVPSIACNAPSAARQGRRRSFATQIRSRVHCFEPAAQKRPLPYAEKLAPLDAIEVEVRTLSDELCRRNIARVDLLKTDCQGFDLWFWRARQARLTRVASSSSPPKRSSNSSPRWAGMVLRDPWLAHGQRLLPDRYLRHPAR